MDGRRTRRLVGAPGADGGVALQARSHASCAVRRASAHKHAASTVSWGRGVSFMAAALASWSTRSLPGIPVCAGI